MAINQQVGVTMPGLEAVAPGLLYSREPIFSITRKPMSDLRRLAAESPLGRARICAHHSPADVVQEMLIVVMRESYIRPHKHLAKSESFHMIEGEMDVLIFSDDGLLENVIAMSAYKDSANFYYRLCIPKFHTLVLKSEWALFHETTSGPFNPEDSVGAPWAPSEKGMPSDIQSFRSGLAAKVRAFAGSRN